jgi:hypothetical protein
LFIVGLFTTVNNIPTMTWKQPKMSVRRMDREIAVCAYAVENIL